MADLDSMFERLRHLIEQMEDERSLDRQLQLFDEAAKLERECRAELGKAERHVVEIIEADGSVKPFAEQDPSLTGRGTAPKNLPTRPK